MSSTAIAVTAIACFLIVFGAFVTTVWLLTRNTNRNAPHQQGCCGHLLHGWTTTIFGLGRPSLLPHNHDREYAKTNHTHNQYAPIDHKHPEYALRGHTHQGYATRADLEREVARLDRRIDRLERLIATFRTMFIQSSAGILLGVVLGAIGGAIIGLILNMLLPHSVFEIHGVAKINVGLQQIVENITIYNSWPKYGIVLGCALIGALVGAVVSWVVGMVRSRRQSTPAVA